MTSSNRARVRLRPEIASLPPYRQGKAAAADAFKLSSNENPFPPLPGVLESVAAHTAINRYPDALASRLRAALAERFGVAHDEVHIGAGSVALLAQLITAAAGPGDEVVFAWRSFEAYPGLVTVAGASSVLVPLTADGRHDVDAMAAAVTERTRAVIVCTPNNPTGTTVTASEVERLLAAVPQDVLVILDEAYQEFVTDPDAVNGEDLMGRHPNLVVLRTFSKAYGLAGLRVGYAIGAVEVLDAARSTAIPLSVTGLSEDAALASLERDAELRARVDEIVARRVELSAALAERGFVIPEAQGNFVWLAAGAQTVEVAEILDRNGVVARAFAGDGVRISIGEHESIAAIVRAADEIQSALPEGHQLLGSGGTERLG